MKPSEEVFSLGTRWGGIGQFRWLAKNFLSLEGELHGTVKGVKLQAKAPPGKFAAKG
jgi:hypothetical protein